MKRLLLLLNDVLRLHDNPLLQWPQAADAALAVVIFPNTMRQPALCSPRRLQLQLALLQQFQQQLQQYDIPLLICQGEPALVLAELLARYQLDLIVAAEPVAPDERRWFHALPVHFIDTNALWADALRPQPLAPGLSYSAFRRLREPELAVCLPVDNPLPISALQQVLTPVQAASLSAPTQAAEQPLPPQLCHWLPAGFGHSDSVGETGARRQLQQYLTHRHIDHYKDSRNALLGRHFASFLALPLSRGTLSVRWIWQQILDYEARAGQNDGSQWLKYELLWREYFRHLMRQSGNQLFRRRGLGLHPQPPMQAVAKQPERFRRWCLGQTGEPLVDSNMRLLNQTGWMSNRGRQNVASYLIFELGLDWRAGAAYFERQLLDYDVASNWGNWAYIAGGLYAAPRRFHLARQTAIYDPDGDFCRRLGG